MESRSATSLAGRWHGHRWTLGPYLAARVTPPVAPPSRLFRTVVHDAQLGSLPLTGRLSEAPRGGDGRTLVLVVHGLGGSERSYYALRAAQAAARAGWASLRMNHRGADRRGADVYHAGLTDDLRAVLATPSLARFERIVLLGFSMGGHVSFRLLAERNLDPRVQALGAICAPVDLRAGADEIDQPKGAFYRSNVLAGLREILGAVATRSDHLPIGPREARRITTLRGWDDQVVAPRFGFRDANDYYGRMAAGPVLDRIRRPTLAVIAERDPMVFTHVVRPWFDAAPNVRTVYTDRGGHVGFPPDLDLGLGAEGPVEDQVLHWLANPF
ncbi:MAG: alpha/beta fold hydrolase [Myxococcota bacterium]